MKRRLCIVAIFLLAGAVVNVAVAWGCWRGMSLLGSVATSMPVEEARELVEYLRLPALPPPIGIIKGTTIDCGFGATLDAFQTQTQTKVFSSARRIQIGWPILALRGYWINEEKNGVWSARSRGVLPVQRRGPPFPLLPVWPGFAVNTLLYAVVVVVLWLAVRAGYVFVFRYLTRSRRGLCPKCAYPMGESAVCSECGKTLPSSRRRIIVQ